MYLNHGGDIPQKRLVVEVFEAGFQFFAVANDIEGFLAFDKSTNNAIKEQYYYKELMNCYTNLYFMNHKLRAMLKFDAKKEKGLK